MDSVYQLVEFILHFDKYLNATIEQYGTWTYAILFLIVFCETGLVVTPILPGDSLLFAAGAMAASGSLDPHVLAILLTVAAVLGDAVNYSIGYFLGPKVFSQASGWLLNRKYLERTREFYDRHGGKTIVIARFMPIIRTFAPFVAGIGKMEYWKFALYNVSGGIFWVALFIYGGYLFGNVPLVKENFSLVILGIIFVSILPGVIELGRVWLARRRSSPTPPAA